MGLNIGNSISALAGVTGSTPRVRPAVQDNPVPPEIPGSSRDGGEPVLFSRDNRPEPVRVGFGEGTVSGPSVALAAIDDGVQVARQAIPTIEENRAASRARLATQRAQNAPEFLGGQENAIRVDLPDASDQARAQINSVSAQAAPTNARLESQPEPTGRAQASIQTEGESVPFGPAAGATPDTPFGGANGSGQFDVSV